MYTQSYVKSVSILNTLDNRQNRQSNKINTKILLKHAVKFIRPDYTEFLLSYFLARTALLAGAGTATFTFLALAVHLAQNQSPLGIFLSPISSSSNSPSQLQKQI